MNDGFFYRAKQTVYKWWCIIYKPVYKLIHHGYWPEEKEPYYTPKTESEIPSVTPETPSDKPDMGEDVAGSPVSSSPDSENSALRAQEILDRLNREAAEDEAKKQAEIEVARKKAEEDARLASILKSTRRDISQYINEGMANREHIADEEPASEVDDDVLKRAQEIMDRLNKEAAEDEAKKQAEIEAAKDFARKNNL